MSPLFPWDSSVPMRREGLQERSTESWQAYSADPGWVRGFPQELLVPHPQMQVEEKALTLPVDSASPQNQQGQSQKVYYSSGFW